MGGYPVNQTPAHGFSDGLSLASQSSRHLGDNAEDIFSRSPAIDAATVVSDLIPLTAYRFDQMQVLNSVHFAQNHVANANAFFTGRF